MAKYVDKQELLDLLEKKIKADNERRMAVIDNDFIDIVNDATVISDMVEVDDISEQIIRKKAKVSDYWQNDVKQYRAMQGYSNIEHDVDNFLRGYNEAVEDILAILDGTPKERGGEVKIIYNTIAVLFCILTLGFVDLNIRYSDKTQFKWVGWISRIIQGGN